MVARLIGATLQKIGKPFRNPFKKYGISWMKYKILKHQDYHKPGSIRFAGLTIQYNHPIEILHSLQEIFIDEIYKIGSKPAQPYIIDCGANTGMSVINLKQQFPDAEILAFEPDEENFRLLQYNTSSFTRVMLENKAVWDKEELLYFEMSGTQGSLMNANQPDSKPLKPVAAVRLFNYLDRPVFFLKIDIEGAEYKVIRDCAGRLLNVENLFIEYHGSFEEQSHLDEILNILTHNSFFYYIKEATSVYPSPFAIKSRKFFDIQLNIFAFKQAIHD